MKYVYIMAAWENAAQTHPAIYSFTNLEMAKAIARRYRDQLRFEEVILRRDAISCIGWSNTDKFIEF